MKLLYLMTGISSKGGLTRIVFDKINYLINNYDIEVIYFGKGNEKPFYNVHPNVKFHSIKGVDAYSSFVNKIYAIRNVVKQYTNLINEINPDIIINANANLLSWIVPFYNRHIPKIVELHQSYDGVKIFNANAYGKNSFKSKFLFFIRNIIYPKYNAVVVLTDKDKKQWGYKNVIVIPNFTNIAFDGHKDYTQKNIIWVGRLTHQKGCDMLIEIWTKFIKICPQWHLIIIGDNVTKGNIIKNEVVDFAAKNKDSVTHVLETTNIMEFYKKGALFISTSRFEGLPLVLIEAATMCLPIVGFDITGNDNVVKNGVNGELIKPYEIDEFVAAMQKYCDNIELLMSSGLKSKEISKAFSKEIIMHRWMKLFENMMINKK